MYQSNDENWFRMDMRLFVDIQFGIGWDNNQVDISTITQLLFSFSDHQKGNGFDISIILGYLYRFLLL